MCNPDTEGQAGHRKKGEYEIWEMLSDQILSNWKLMDQIICLSHMKKSPKVAKVNVLDQDYLFSISEITIVLFYFKLVSDIA